MAKNGKGSVMVVGAGIAGIQASLDLADSGYLVYLVDKNTAIGGTMAQLDKTFPTNDCSMCIISPKLVEAGRHLNIELMTMTQVEDVSGEEGDFTVTLREDDWTTFLTTRGSGNFQLGRSAWCGDFNDPYTFLHILESTSEYNDGSFSNTAFDTLIADSAETDTPEALYTQAEDIISEQVPIIPVYFYSGRVLLKRNIRGYAINNIEQYRYTKDLTRL